MPHPKNGTIFILLTRRTGKSQKKRILEFETNFEFWKNELKPPYFVENIINNGYIMPFTTIPSPFRSSNNKSSLHHPQFVSQAITKLLQNNCVEEHKQKLYCCNALTESGGKKLHILF